MRKLTIIALVLTLALSLLAGCRSRSENEAANTTATTQARIPDSNGVLPDDDMLPDHNDTIDPSNGADNGMVDPTNGANHDTAPTGTVPNGTTVPHSKMRPMR